MNRIISAFVIVGIIMLFTFYGNISVKKTTSRFEESLVKIELLAQNENFAALTEIDLLIKDFSNNKSLLELFIKRDYVANTSVNIKGLSAYVSSETWRDLESETAKAREQINMIQRLFFKII